MATGTRLHDSARTQRFLIGGLASGFASAVTLLLPWFEVGSRSRSSIELIGSLGALDVIDGNLKRFVVAGWFAVPVLVGVAMLAAAAGRNRLSAALLVPLGPVLVGAVLLVLIEASSALVWGAYLTAVFAIAATASAIMVLVRLGKGAR